MAQYLDYEGTHKLTELIIGLIKEGDNDVISSVNEIREQLESSDSDSIRGELEALKSLLLGKIDDVDESVDVKIDAAIEGIIAGAPEALDTLKEIADWIASDESGVADLVSEVSTNTENITNLQNTCNSYKTRIEILEAATGTSSSEVESIADRLDDLEESRPISITNDEIDDVLGEKTYIIIED